MWTRLIYVTLMTVCLATFIQTDIVVDTSSEDVFVSEEDFQGNQTTDDNLTTKVYDTTKIDIDTSTVSEDSCGDPPSALHAKIGKGKKYRYLEGDVVHYSCDFGYVTRAYEWSSKCIFSEDTNTLEWTPPQIICSPRSCGDPGFVENGHRIGSLFTFPNQVAFECDEGYQLMGNGIRYCKTSGTWSGSLPICERIFCNTPSNPENGKVSYTSLEFGSELVYECNKGFILKNLQPRICSENGTWSGYIPICQEAQCEYPIAPEHGTVQIVGGKPSVGSRAIYSCEGGRFLVGSTSSTCLDIGQWTFPTPKCLEPCAVPKVPHGKIGMYERHYRKLRYKEISEGTKIEDGAELYLSCESKYEPFGTTNIEEKIHCNHGNWDRYPLCEPATCRQPPPQTPNARIREASFSRRHGAGVIYDCDTYFLKYKFGNVSCQYGTWKGGIPTCKNTQCDVDSLTSFSIKKTTKRYYKSQEALTLYCETGYTTSKPNHRIMCLNGDWKGLNPLPCTPANCLDAPPEIENGQITSLAIHHSSEVTYVCNEFFILTNSDSKVQCKFGKWTGTKPTCKDTRCHVGNLKVFETISADTDIITYSGDTLQVQCAEGFSSTGVKPKCVNGEWEIHQPLCKENGCIAHNINHGKFKEKVRRESCNFWTRKCSYWHVFEDVRRNQNLPAGSYLYVSCDIGYTHHGGSNINIKTICSRGQWKPSAVCLKRGTSYYEEAITPNTHLVAEKSTVNKSNTITMYRTTRLPETETSKGHQVRPPQPPEAEDTQRMVESHNVNCSCTYFNTDSVLTAFAGTEKLQMGVLVKEGCKVRFHCSPVGNYHLNGPREITCKDCRTWHSSEYPQCESPKEGDTVFRFEGNFNELSGGAIGVLPGSSLRVFCIPIALNIYPQWVSFPNSPTTNNFNYEMAEQGNVFKTQILEINNIGPEHNGNYECAINGYRPNSITMHVITLETACSTFSEDEFFTVFYDKGQTLNSSAHFSCKDPKQKVVGPSILTCLANGQWSGDPPQCISVCPILEETEGMFITYNDGRKTLSSATFNCDLPRVLSGVPSTVCKLNGEWADPPPICEMPACKISDLYNIVPEYVVPNVDNLEGNTVPYDFSLNLECDEDRRLVGTSNKAKCKHEGQWDIAKVQCVIGCAPVVKLPDSEIVIDPEEAFYEIGQFVTFSCVPGKQLNMELERIMCLPGGWSQKVVPTCVDGPTDDYVNDEGTVPTGTEKLSPTVQI